MSLMSIGIDVDAITAAKLDRAISRDIYTYRSKCPKVIARIGDGNLRCLIDSGAEVNVIREDVAIAAGLVICTLPRAIRDTSITSALEE